MKGLERKVWNERFGTKGLERKVWNERLGTNGLERKVGNKIFGTKDLDRKVWDKIFKTVSNEKEPTIPGFNHEKAVLTCFLHGFLNLSTNWILRS